MRVTRSELAVALLIVAVPTVLVVGGLPPAARSAPVAPSLAVGCPAGLEPVLAGLCTHGDDRAFAEQRKKPRPTRSPRPDPSPSPSPTPAPDIVCDGDGVSGRRVQVILARAADVPDRLGAASPVQWAVGVDRIFDDSAQQTGGTRRVRYVTTAACQLDVQVLVLPPEADDDFGATITAVQAAGHSRPDRKYLIFLDAQVYCGIATVATDDQPVWNASDNHAGYSRVDRPCWGAPVAAHELAHNLGAVQLSAPRSDGSWHCTTEYDLMCYGGQQSYLCPVSNADLLDCHHDDYFSTASEPYLDTHWNVARSGFLVHAPDPGPSPTPAPSPTPSCSLLLTRLCP